MQLKKMKISKKSLRKEASERSYALRDAYKLKVSHYTSEMLVCIDESAANEHTTYRKRGWSEYGIVPKVKRPLKRSQRWSILPAYTIDGVLTSFVYHGAINGPLFLWFLQEQVLPRCNPFPGPRSVLIMDNCSTHHVREVRELCERYGVILQFLPPYSPDFNPIEELFSVIKAWLKKHHELAGTMRFKDFLQTAVEACSQQRIARGHFEHAGYAIGRARHWMEDFEDSDTEDFE